MRSTVSPRALSGAVSEPALSEAQDLGAITAHLERPAGRGHLPPGAFGGAAGGAPCGDLVRISLSLSGSRAHACAGDRIADAGFDASGCGALIAAGSAAVSLLRGAPLLEAARIGPDAIAAELGGLSEHARHAAELVSDALHRALGAAARHGARLAPLAGRTLVAMSGGVDSAVAALLLRRSAHDVVAVTLELWADPENDARQSCCSAHSVRQARAVAHDLGIPHLSVDLRAEFRSGVVEPWLAGHRGGLTPNPCLRCNGSVRLDAMIALCDRLGAEALATGHYARLHRPPDAAAPLLRLAADRRKDQSYALAGLAPSSLARLRFPLSELTKDQVRAIAADASLAVAGQPDSQDLCFLAGTSHRRFLERHGGIAGRPGPIVDAHGLRLGTHAGHQRFTVGQRHGLGIAAPGPHFVLRTDPAANSVTVGPREALRTDRIAIDRVTLHRPGSSVDGVRIRSRGALLACTLPGAPRAGRHRTVAVALASPTERTAPGQLACLYAGELIVGHGTVAREHA
ncbi:MAG: tRNA 2-thiouridine(34) synthase MnmA [Acidobacteriota bacterium]|nr:tRNA 2-thiouridine(34) synthase MnmA [Acidobacteriota bacterium]